MYPFYVAVQDGDDYRHLVEHITCDEDLMNFQEHVAELILGATEYFDDTNNVNDIIHRIERLTWTLGRISRSITPCDEPVFLTIGHDTIHGTIVVNKQKYNISFLFDPDDPKDVSTIEGTSPLRYQIPETNKNRPIFLDVNQSDARLVLTRPADWSNLFITYSMDTDYWFHDFNISHFKQFLYEFERVRSIFTNVE